jgi:hypothetical protein
MYAFKNSASAALLWPIWRKCLTEGGGGFTEIYSAIKINKIIRDINSINNPPIIPTAGRGNCLAAVYLEFTIFQST